MNDTSMLAAENRTPPTVAECEVRLNQCRDDLAAAQRSVTMAQDLLKIAITDEREAVKAMRTAYEAAMPKRPRKAKAGTEGTKA